MVSSGTEEVEFFNSFLKNDLSPEMIWKKKNSPTTLHKYGMQWDNKSIIFQLIFEKCPNSRDEMEQRKKDSTADHKYGVQWEKRSRIFQLISKKYGMQWDKRSRIF